MVSTYERWQRNRPVLDSLPGINGGYSDNIVADWLTAFPDGELARSKFGTLDDGLRQIDPLTCDDRWLDLLAPLCGWHKYWDRNWPEASKRRLLAESYTLVWPNYGTLKTLSFVLTTLGIEHIIRQGDRFIIGEDTVGDELGVVAWQYSIILKGSLFNSPQQKLTERINRLFGPLWCKSEIIFDDAYFEPTKFITIGPNTLLSLNSPQTVIRV